MSASEPLLKSPGGVLQASSESKIFFTADELLQYVRRKYHSTQDRRHKDYTQLRSTKAGLYVESQPITQTRPEGGNIDARKESHLEEINTSHVAGNAPSDKQGSKSTPETAVQHVRLQYDLQCPNKMLPTAQNQPCRSQTFSTSSEESENQTVPAHFSACHPHSLAQVAHENKLRTGSNVRVDDLEKNVTVTNSNSNLRTPEERSSGGESTESDNMKAVRMEKGQANENQPLLQRVLGSKDKSQEDKSTCMEAFKLDRLKVSRITKKMLPKCYMASFQSPRTQCCCCAVGVFAAMFGIFMLSAGVCIVLNVTFMEVDTSGLPPNLHNESGKKVVGIILICVAITFLGLSATVSVVYFTVCSRRTQAGSVTTAHGSGYQHKQHTPGAFPGLERPASRGSVSSGKSSLTVAHLDGAMYPKAHTPGRPEYKKPKSYRGRKNMSRTILPPHEEEDPESAKSSLELNTAHSTRRSSHGRIAEHVVSGEEMVGSSNTLVVSSSSRRTPMIVVDYIHQSDSKVARDEIMETNLNDTSSIFEEDSVSNACSDLYEAVASARRLSLYDSVESGFTNWSSTRTHEHGALDDSDLQHPPEQPYNIEVLPDLSTLDRVPASQSLELDSHKNILKFKNAGIPSSSSPSSSYAAQNALADEERDRLPDLPDIFGHQDDQSILQDHSEQDSMSESRSSFNSAFSLDGDDPDQSEIDRLQRRMENLVESNVSDQ